MTVQIFIPKAIFLLCIFIWQYLYVWRLEIWIPLKSEYFCCILVTSHMMALLTETYSYL
jgi:hypothetical protein